MTKNNRLEDENLENVSGGVIQANNALFDKRKNDVQVNNALMDGDTVVQSRLLAGEARQTASKNDPLKKERKLDPFGSDLNAGSGLA